VYNLDNLKAFAHSDTSDAGKILNSVISRAFRPTIHIDIKDLANKSGIEPDALVARIVDYFHEGLIAWPEFEAVYKMKLQQLAPTTMDQITQLSGELFDELERNGPLSTERVEKLNSLFRGKRCYAAELTQYFGMNLPNEMDQCNQCTWCTTRTELKIPGEPWGEYYSKR
jgi:methionyl-tRNA synthetase